MQLLFLVCFQCLWPLITDMKNNNIENFEFDRQKLNLLKALLSRKRETPNKEPGILQSDTAVESKTELNEVQTLRTKQMRSQLFPEFENGDNLKTNSKLKRRHPTQSSTIEAEISKEEQRNKGEVSSGLDLEPMSRYPEYPKRFVSQLSHGRQRQVQDQETTTNSLERNQETTITENLNSRVMSRYSRNFVNMGIEDSHESRRQVEDLRLENEKLDDEYYEDGDLYDVRDEQVGGKLENSYELAPNPESESVAANREYAKRHMPNSPDRNDNEIYREEFPESRVNSEPESVVANLEYAKRNSLDRNNKNEMYQEEFPESDQQQQSRRFSNYRKETKRVAETKALPIETEPNVVPDIDEPISAIKRQSPSDSIVLKEQPLQSNTKYGLIIGCTLLITMILSASVAYFTLPCVLQDQEVGKGKKSSYRKRTKNKKEYIELTAIDLENSERESHLDRVDILDDKDLLDSNRMRDGMKTVSEPNLHKKLSNDFEQTQTGRKVPQAKLQTLNVPSRENAHFQSDLLEFLEKSENDCEREVNFPRKQDIHVFQNTEIIHQNASKVFIHSEKDVSMCSTSKSLNKNSGDVFSAGVFPNSNNYELSSTRQSLERGDGASTLRNNVFDMTNLSSEWDKSRIATTPFSQFHTTASLNTNSASYNSPSVVQNESSSTLHDPIVIEIGCHMGQKNIQPGIARLRIQTSPSRRLNFKAFHSIDSTSIPTSTLRELSILSPELMISESPGQLRVRKADSSKFNPKHLPLYLNISPGKHRVIKADSSKFNSKYLHSTLNISPSQHRVMKADSSKFNSKYLPSTLNISPGQHQVMKSDSLNFNPNHLPSTLNKESTSSRYPAYFQETVTDFKSAVSFEQSASGEDFCRNPYWTNGPNSVTADTDAFETSIESDRARFGFIVHEPRIFLD